ncbi:unnamed protein product [Owenia fusiformis]|uniref:Uncharacterized protein n=1 Tax=Owenia fusiformis TaxID=6347 RepID=A0A8J1XXW6_OWEFU|nr:unnamed protein product [Owenia fusiformis]
MASHQPTKPSDPSDGFKCPQCGKCFQKRTVFKYHQDMHILENTFSGSEPKQKTPFQSGSNNPVTVCPSKSYELSHSKYDKDLDILQSIFSSETPTYVKESAPQIDSPPAIQCKVCKLPFSNEQDLLNHSYIDCIRVSSGNKVSKLPERTRAKMGVNIEPLNEPQGHGDKRSRSRSPERDLKRLKVPPVSDSVTAVLKSFTYKCNNCSGEFTNFKRLKMHQIDGCNKPIDVIDDGGNEKNDTPEPVKDSLPVMGSKSYLQNKICAGCALTFETIGDLEDHLRGSKQPECWSKSFPDKVMTANKNFPCGDCFERFTKLDDLFEHDNNCTGYTCFKCSIRFDSAVALSEHAISHGMWKCRHCPKSYPKKKQMMMHIKLEHPEQLGIKINPGDEKIVKCRLCRQIFQKPESLEIHMKEHKEVPTLPCEECDRIFTFKWELKSHLKETHGMTLAEHECISCGAKFPKLRGLRHHYRVDCKGEKKVCFRCNMTFEDHNLFKEHMEEHKEQWRARFKHVQFKCKRCHKVFGDHKTLQYHIYSCTGVPSRLPGNVQSKLPENVPSTFSKTQKSNGGNSCPACKTDFEDLFNFQMHIYSGRCSSSAETSDTRSEVVMAQRGNHSVPENADSESVWKSGEQNQFISAQDNPGISDTRSLTHKEYGSVQKRMENPNWNSGQQNEYAFTSDSAEIYSQIGTQNKYGSVQDNLGISVTRSLTHQEYGSIHNSSGNPDWSSGQQNEHDSVQDNSRIPNPRIETQQKHVPLTNNSEKSPLEETPSSVVDSSKLVGTMVCKHCNKHFFSKKKFNSHVRYSFCDLSEDQIYKCILCNQRFRTDKQLFTHMKKCPRQDANVDLEALKKKEEKRLVKKARKQQKIEQAAEENRICPYCGRVSHSQMALEEHKRRHIEEPTIKCITCDKLFYTQQALENHELWHINPFNPKARKPHARSLKK